MENRLVRRFFCFGGGVQLGHARCRSIGLFFDRVRRGLRVGDLRPPVGISASGPFSYRLAKCGQRLRFVRQACLSQCDRTLGAEHVRDRLG